jgi:hypothetical protein
MCTLKRKEVLVVAHEQKTARAKEDYQNQLKDQITRDHGGPGVKVLISFLHIKKFNPKKPIFKQRAKRSDLILSDIGPIECPGIKTPVVVLS